MMYLFLRVFTVTMILASTGFGASLAVTFYFIGLQDFALTYGFLGGFVCGILGALIVSTTASTTHLKAVKELPYYKPGMEYLLNYEKSVEVNLPFDDVWRESVEILRQLGFSNISEDSHRRIISAKSGFSKYSYGERVTLHFNSENVNRILVSVKSQPRMPIATVDGGTNIKNVMNVSSMLSKLKEKK
ncbi:MAG: hypothetical protein AAF495_11690 [Pseudomonadota bacterium]